MSAETDPSPPLLAARALTFTRNDAPVFGPLDFAVAAGEALLVQGDNGAGKTSLLRVLAGLLHADSGEIQFDGKRARFAAQRQREQQHYQQGEQRGLQGVATPAQQQAQVAGKQGFGRLKQGGGAHARRSSSSMRVCTGGAA